jgi:hypothetical protein
MILFEALILGPKKSVQIVQDELETHSSCHPQEVFKRSWISIVGQACFVSEYLSILRIAFCSGSRSVKSSPPKKYLVIKGSIEALRLGLQHIQRAIAAQAVFMAGGARRFEIAAPHSRWRVVITSRLERVR